MAGGSVVGSTNPESRRLLFERTQIAVKTRRTGLIAFSTDG
jgi:hypothetical protein